METTDMVAVELLKRRMECDIFDDQECLLDPAIVEKYDVIIPAWSMGEISDKAKRGLCNAVCHGVGLAGWHGGMGDASGMILIFR